jgi:hypothetical protein
MEAEEAKWFREHGATMGVGVKAPTRKAGTDYNKWGSYNVEEEEASTDQKFLREDFQQAEKITEDLSTNMLVSAGTEAQQLAEALRAQAAVEALKASGGGGASGRARRKRNQNQAAAGAANGDNSGDGNGNNDNIPKPSNVDTLVEGQQQQPQQEGVVPAAGVALPAPPPLSTSSTTSTTQDVISKLSDVMNECSVEFAGLLQDMERLVADVDKGPQQQQQLKGGIGISRACERGLALMTRVDVFIRRNLRVAKDVETSVIAGGWKNIPQVRSSMTVLERIEESAQLMSLKVASKTAIAALRSRRHALAVDVTRFWLKNSMQGSRAAQEARDAKDALKDAARKSSAAAAAAAGDSGKDTKEGGNGNDYDDDDDDERSRAPQASIWLLRALAFLGMGCTYLANTHVRQAKRLCPSFPDINVVQDTVDRLEEQQMSQLNRGGGSFLPSTPRLSDETLVVRQLLIMADYVTFLSQQQVDGDKDRRHTMVRGLDMHNITPTLLKCLIDPTNIDSAAVDDAAAAVGSGASGRSGHLHMEEAVEDEDKDVEHEHEQEQPSGDKQYLDAWLLQLASALPTGSRSIANSGAAAAGRSSLLLRAVHEQYYQAQLLYLESLYRSAFFKYCAVVLFSAQCGGINNNSNNDDEMSDYLRGVQSACLVNAAYCRAASARFTVPPTKDRVCSDADVIASRLEHAASPLLWLATHDTAAHSPSSAASRKEALESTLVCLMKASPLVLCHAGLRLCNSVLGCLRAVEASETMHCYDHALYFLTRAWTVLLNREEGEEEDKRVVAAWMEVDPQSCTTGDREALWAAVWRACEAANTAAPATTPTETTSGEAVTRYPANQRFSQAFMSVQPLETLGTAAAVGDGDQFWCCPVLSPREVPSLVAHLWKTRARLLFKRRRFEGV